MQLLIIIAHDFVAVAGMMRLVLEERRLALQFSAVTCTG
jgi:hypothetical protein